MLKIYWSKMHVKEYGGNCVNCGGRCTNTESEKNWGLALDELERARYVENDKKRAAYLMKKIENCQNWQWVK